jgi:hypothetical protein
MHHTVEKLNTEPVSHSYDDEISHFVKSAKWRGVKMRNGKYEISHFSGWFPFAFAIFLLMSEVGIWFLVAAYNPPVVVIGIQFREEVQYQVSVPITAFQELSMEIKAETPSVATVKLEVPDGYATGKVRFLSLESSPVTFGKDTIIARQGEVQYKLTQAVTVPGFSGSPGVAEAVEVADKPGTVGNSNGIGSYVLVQLPAKRVRKPNYQRIIPTSSVLW